MRTFACLSLSAVCVCALAQSVHTRSQSLEIDDSQGKAFVDAVAPDVLRVIYKPQAGADKPTLMMALGGLRAARPVGAAKDGALTTGSLRVQASPTELTIVPAEGATLRLDLAALAGGAVRLTHAATENLYGMRGYGLFYNWKKEPRLDPANGLLRNSGAPVAAGFQGDGGAPLAYSPTWGVLIDSIDGEFNNDGGVLEFKPANRRGTEAYLVLGPPKRTLEVATLLTGKPPMPPKWAIGFMNSQWGTDEQKIKDIVATYRQKQIPIDSFIMDFDYKAWGEDNYGEMRWNSTRGPGDVQTLKFPDGQSGLFGKEMAAQGIHLMGIMKPRFLIENTEGKPTVAGAEAMAHGWFLPNEKPYKEYFSNRPALDVDFSKPAARQWFWSHAKNLFETGISGWWNDEADDGYPSLGFFQMQQALYEGQRSISDLRVFSINRNFYLGAQRYAFATWSGDIDSGFKVMSAQRARMLALIDLGQPHWTMDTGGFHDHPTPENYARWMEFAAVVPIMRVHNVIGEHRQPWIFGPVAEAAAKKAIDLRYALAPSIYSWEHAASQTGIGLVRPLFWEFPEDPQCANATDAWMFGDAFLVAPVMERGQTAKSVYLPAGKWFDYANDQAYDGGQIVSIPTDAVAWSDIPMFVRGGSIVATQEVEQFAGQKKIEEIVLDVWPDSKRGAKFEVYDDDGSTYANERGVFFSQQVAAKPLAKGGGTIEFAAPRSHYATTIKRYRVRVHGAYASATWNGAPLKASVEGGVLQATIPAGKAGTLAFLAGRPS